MPWPQIRSLPECKLISPPGTKYEFFLLKNTDETHWLVGQYNELTSFASALRQNRSFRNFLGANQVRLGFRKTDIAPVGERQERYGAKINGINRNRSFIGKRQVDLGRPVEMGKAPPNKRVTDMLENVLLFWQSQTPQSHHIVEFNHLETLQVSRRKGERTMDYLRLPAVLLAAEFHQRYISMFLKPTHTWNREKLETKMHATYSDIYLNNGDLFKPLWLITSAIFERAAVIA
jgi:hypothetical protein